MADYALEGGPFVKACADLLTKSFCLTWYDRFTDLSAVTRSSAERLDSSVGGGDPPCVSMPALTQALVSTAVGAALSVADAAATAVGSAVKATGGSNRWKYVCPCNTSVWGKPKLKLICGTCQGAFVSADAATG